MASLHICYAYIFKYKHLKDIEIVFDPRYKYEYLSESASIRLGKQSILPENFWGDGIYSLTGIFGDNGSGKSTVCSFLMYALCKGEVGTGYNVDGIIVYERGGRLTTYCNKQITIIGDKRLVIPKQIESPLHLNTFYYCGHFTPYGYDDDDPRSKELQGIHNASDMWLIRKDIINYTGHDSLLYSSTLDSHIKCHLRQNDYRICMTLGNKNLRKSINSKSYHLPRYIIVQPNKSGETYIEFGELRQQGIAQVPKVFTKYTDGSNKLLEQFLDSILINLLAYSRDTEYISIIEEWNRFLSGDEFLNDFSRFILKCKFNCVQILKSIYQVLSILSTNCTFHDYGYGAFYYLDMEKDTDIKSIETICEIQKNAPFICAKYFDFKYSHALEYGVGENLSSGELSILNLISRINNATLLEPEKFANIDQSNLIILDEAETSFHPEWQRRYVKLIVDLMKVLFSQTGSTLQIIITSHSPMLLSDMPKCCVNYLANENSNTVNKRGEQSETFASNVFDLFSMDFFMKNGLIGDFAQERLAKIVKSIENDMIDDEIYKEVELIGDKRIKGYCLHLLTERTASDKAKQMLKEFYLRQANNIH